MALFARQLWRMACLRTKFLTPEGPTNFVGRKDTVDVEDEHIRFLDHKNSLQKGAKANSIQEWKKRKSIKDREMTQGEAAGEEEEADWEKAGKEKREDA